MSSPRQKNSSESTMPSSKLCRTTEVCGFFFRKFKQRITNVAQKTGSLKKSFRIHKPLKKTPGTKKLQQALARKYTQENLMPQDLVVKEMTFSLGMDQATEPPVDNPNAMRPSAESTEPSLLLKLCIKLLETILPLLFLALALSPLFRRR